MFDDDDDVIYLFQKIYSVVKGVCYYLSICIIMLYSGKMYGLYSCERCRRPKTRLELTKAEVEKVVLQSSSLSEDRTASARTQDRPYLHRIHQSYAVWCSVELCVLLCIIRAGAILSKTPETPGKVKKGRYSS